jgi:hypothetical protein
MVLAVLLAAVAGCGDHGTPEDEGFASVHVADVVAHLDGPNKPVLLDANGTDFRAQQGVIPGAVLLSSHSKYDPATELPARKDTPLVFYCANTH